MSVIVKGRITCTDCDRAVQTYHFSEQSVFKKARDKGWFLGFRVDYCPECHKQ